MNLLKAFGLPPARSTVAGGACLAWLGFLAGCADHLPSVLNPSYAQAKLDGREVRIFPIRGLTIENRKDFEDAFPSKGKADSSWPESLFNGLFNENFLAIIDHAKPVLDTTAVRPGSPCRDTVLDIPLYDSTAHDPFCVPDPAALKANGTDPDLGLQLSGIVFKRVSSAGSGPIYSSAPPIHTAHGSIYGPMGGVGGGSEWLEMSGRYLLWDYKAGAPVAYGRLRIQMGFLVYIDYWDWKKVIEEAVERIVGQSPLKGKKLDRIQARQSASLRMHPYGD